MLMKIRQARMPMSEKGSFRHLVDKLLVAGVKSSLTHLLMANYFLCYLFCNAPKHLDADRALFERMGSCHQCAVRHIFRMVSHHPNCKLRKQHLFGGR